MQANGEPAERSEQATMSMTGGAGEPSLTHSEKNSKPLPPGIIKYESIATITNYMKNRKLKF